MDHSFILNVTAGGVVGLVAVALLSYLQRRRGAARRGAAQRVTLAAVGESDALPQVGAALSTRTSLEPASSRAKTDMLLKRLSEAEMAEEGHALPSNEVKQAALRDIQAIMVSATDEHNSPD